MRDTNILASLGLALLLTLLATTACSKPEKVVAQNGETCHFGLDLGWKACNAESVCLKPKDLEYLTPQPTNGEARITTKSGSANKDNYDCYGFLNDKCTLKGTCYAKVNLGEPCAATSAMCKEGECLGNTTDGKIVWTCMTPKEAKAPRSNAEPKVAPPKVAPPKVTPPKIAEPGAAPTKSGTKTPEPAPATP